MSQLTFDTIQVGDRLPPLVVSASAARPLAMDYLGSFLMRWIDQRQLRQFGVTLITPAVTDQTLTCVGEVVEKYQADGKKWIRLELQAINAQGLPQAVGEAVVVF